MKEKILEILNNHPSGLRLREIGSYAGTWHCNLISPIHELEKEGKVKSYTHRDMANMENYNIWKVVK